jgi:hypothetical protein
MDDNKTMKNLLAMFAVLVGIGVGCGVAAVMVATPGV